MKLKKIYILGLILIILVLIAWFWVFKKEKKEEGKIPSPSVESELELKSEELQKLEKLKKEEQPLSITEPGFGRENPFAPY